MEWVEVGIAGVACVVAIIAAVYARSQARYAKDQADSANMSAEAAEEANRLTRQQHAREAAREQRQEQEAQEAALREAEAVHLGIRASGGSAQVSITNSSSRAITNVQITDLRADEPGPWRSWTPNPHVGRQLRVTEWRQIDPQDERTTAVWFLDQNGQHLPQMPAHVRVEVRFRDADGQWWMTELTDGPRRINAPD